MGTNEELDLEEEARPAAKTCCFGKCSKKDQPSASGAGQQYAMFEENFIAVDRLFLVAMPLLFLIFNAIYWMSYGSHFFMEQAKVTGEGNEEHGEQ